MATVVNEDKKKKKQGFTPLVVDLVNEQLGTPPEEDVFGIIEPRPKPSETNEFVPTAVNVVNEEFAKNPPPPKTPEEFAEQTAKNMPSVARETIDKKSFLDRAKERARQPIDIAVRTSQLGKPPELKTPTPTIPKPIENAIRSIENLGLSQPQVFGGTLQMTGAGIQKLGRVTDDPKLADFMDPEQLQQLKDFESKDPIAQSFDKLGKKLRDKGKQILEKNKKALENRVDLMPTDNSFISQLSYSLGSGAFSLAEAATLAAITKNPAAAGPLFGVQTAADTFNNALEQGLTDEEAFKYSIADGVLEAGLESISLNKLFGKNSKTVLKNILENALTEGSTEGLQELKGNIIRKYGLKMNVKEADNVIMSMLVGAIMGGAVGGGANNQIPETVAARLEEKGVSEEAQKEFLKISEDIANKLKEKGWSPTQLKEAEQGLKEQVITPEELKRTTEGTIPVEPINIVDKVNNEIANKPVQQEPILKDKENTALYQESFIERINKELAEENLPQSFKKIKQDAKTIEDRKNKDIKRAQIKPLFQEINSPKMHSKLFQQLESSPQEKMSSDQFKGWMQKQGIKQEELDWLDIDTYLDGKKSITKQEMLDYIGANMLEVEETTLEAKDERRDLRMKQNPNNSFLYDVIDDNGNIIKYNLSQDSASEFIDTYWDGRGETKFGQYVQPGGTNYREVLFRLPAKEINTRDSIAQEKFGKKFDDLNMTEIMQVNSFRQAEEKKDKQYTSSHFDQPNILAHTRLNDRVDSEGNKVLFVEEVQSDWHQEGRKKGYATNKVWTKKDIDITERNGTWSIGVVGTAHKFTMGTKENAEKNIEGVLRDLNKGKLTTGAVSNAPLKKTWHEFVMKKVLQMASDQGYDKVAWTTGEMQAERYDLSKQISEVKYDPNSENLQAYDLNGKSVIDKNGVKEADLEDYIGKEATKKLLESQPNSDFRFIQGEDLKVGGEGMKAFYNKMIPNFMAKYTKKLGGKVEVIEIDVPRGRPTQYADFNEYNKTKDKTEKVLSITITPEMRKEYTSKGQPLFQQKKDKTSPPILEVAEARRILKKYNIDINAIKQVGEITMPNGKKAAGSYLDWVIKIAQIAQNTTGAHEAFHFIRANFADESLYQKAVAEVKQNTNLKDDAKIEEHLAEKFGEYRATKRGVTGFVRQFFNKLMFNLKQAFGKDKNIAKLFKDFESGKGTLKTDKITKTMYQSLNDQGKQLYINKLLAARKKIINDELRIMRNSLETAEAGKRFKGGGTKSTFPTWFNDLGFSTKEKALNAFNKNNSKYAEILAVAKERLEQGVEDKKTFEAVEPSPEYADIIQAIKEVDPEAIKVQESKEEFKPKTIVKEKVVEKVIHNIIEKEIPVGPTKEDIENIKNEIKTKEETRATKKIEIVKTKKQEALNKLRLKIKNTQAFKTEIVNYANFVLDPEDRGKLLATVKNIKTPKNVQDAFAFINEIEAKAAKKESISILKKTISKLDLKKMRPEYRDKIQSILDSISLTKPTNKTIQRLESMRSFVEANPNHIIPDSALARLDQLDKISVKDMTKDDIDLLNKTINHLESLAQMKDKLIRFGKAKDFYTIRDQAIANLDKQKEVERNPDLISTKDKDYEAGILKQFFTTMQMNQEMNTQILDKEDNGIIQNISYKDFDRGRTIELAMKQETEDFFKSELKDYDIDTWSEALQPNKDKVKYIKTKLDSGKEIEYTKAQRIYLYLSSLNENSLKHIVYEEGGNGIVFAQAQSRIVSLTYADLDRIIKDMTPQELKAANAFYHYYNVIQKEKINKRSVELNGFENANEEHYVPIETSVYDRQKDALKLGLMPEDMKRFNQFTLEGMGMFKERTGAHNAIVLNDIFDLTARKVRDASAYYGLAAPLRNAKMLLSDNDFQVKVINTYGKHYLKTLKNFVLSIEGSTYGEDQLTRFATKLSNKLSVGILGLNPGVIAKQPVSFVLANTEIDAKYLAKAVKAESKEVISKYSPQLRERLKGRFTEDIGQTTTRPEAIGLFTDKKGFDELVLMKGIGEADYQAIGRIWTAVKYEIEEKFPELTGEEKMYTIAQRTEEIIRRTQPTFDIKDRSEIGRSRNAWIKFLTKFSSQRNKNYIITRRAVERYVANPSGSNMRKMFKDLALVRLIAPLLIYMIDSASKMWRNIGKEDSRTERQKEADKQRRLANASLSVIQNNLGDIYFIGNLLRPATQALTGKQYDSTSVSDPLMQTANDIVEGSYLLGKAINQMQTKESYKTSNKKYGYKKGDLKYKKTIKRAIMQTLESTARLAGQPVGNAYRYYIAPAYNLLKPKPEKKGPR